MRPSIQIRAFQLGMRARLEHHNCLDNERARRAYSSAYLLMLAVLAQPSDNLQAFAAFGGLVGYLFRARELAGWRRGNSAPEGAEGENTDGKHVD